MEKRYWIILWIASLLILNSCASVKPLVTASGEQITVFILVDPNTEGLTKVQITNRNSICKWMRKDLINIFKGAGFKTQAISSKDQFIAGNDGNYLLHMTITKYHTPSKAARFWAGYAAGPTLLHIKYELYGADEEPIISRTNDASSIKGEIKCAKKLDRMTLDTVSIRIKKLHPQVN